MTQDELRYAPRRKSIDPIIFFDEVWKKIDIIENIRPIYWISTYGRVYNENTGYIMQGHIVDNGYEVVSFYKNDGSRIYCHTHRLLMLVFNPIPNSDLYVVNHKDGNKLHNWIWNLEWTTQKGNVEHAFATGLRKCGEDSSHNIFSNETVNKVCKCMEDGMNIYQLSQVVFNSKPNQQIKSLCTTIFNNKGWKEISSNYDIKNYKRNRVFSIPQIELICMSISNNKNIETPEILNILGIIPSSNDEYDIYHRAIKNIRTGKSCKDISSKYNI